MAGDAEKIFRGCLCHRESGPRADRESFRKCALCLCGSHSPVARALSSTRHESPITSHYRATERGLLYHPSARRWEIEDSMKSAAGWKEGHDILAAARNLRYGAP